MRSSNPVLSDSALSSDLARGGEAMSIQGVVNKSFVLLLLLLTSAWWIWSKMVPATSVPLEEAGDSAFNVGPWIMGGLIGGVVFGFVTIFVKKISMYTAPLYALCEGLILGGVSFLFEKSYPGIVMQAVGITFLTLFSLLTLYKLRIVTVTDKFRMGVFAATGAIALFYFVTWILSLFGAGKGLIMMYSASTPLGIGISLIVAGVAALNLLLDFDLIERVSAQGAPKYMEWYCGFALMVTLVWLYLEILRLLAKFRDRR